MSGEAPDIRETVEQAVAAMLADLADALVCAQCGHTFAHRACGPTHAAIAADPRQHRLIAPLLAAEPASLQRRLYDECETANWDPGKRNTFAEEMAHLHEEVSEAFREWRLHKDTKIRWTCERCGRAVPFDMDLDTIRHPESSHHYTGEQSERGRGQDCRGQFKPTGVPIEFADVLIGLFYNAELHGFDLLEAVEIKHQHNLRRDYVAEGRQLHVPERADRERGEATDG